jgi:glycolate oxidase FAD binding subunit
VKSGGTVVKNVAGYDLGKLMSGSQGTFAAIVGATFKLSPIPAASATLVATRPEPAPLASAAAAVAASQLEPAAFDIRMSGGRAMESRNQLLLRFATTPEAVARQVERAQELVGAAERAEVMTGAGESDLWRGVAREPWARPGLILRLSWLQSSLPAVLALVAELGARTDSFDLAGRVVVGAGVLRFDGGQDAQVAVIERLRSAGIVGNVVMLRADTEIKRRVDVFAASGDAIPLLREVKRAFDPAGILNAGRGIV